MPTTSNFGWTTPADTDLVKDGAAAIRTLGNGIDSSLVDLKGGTTGQVLAKASNTDLDFTWSSVDPLTILDAKGDLISATAADTPARLAVGTNGQVLTANSSTSTGLEWTTISAGGMTLLSTTSLTTATTNITGISQSYTNLMIEIAGISIPTGQRLNIQLRNNTTAQTCYLSGVRTATASQINGLSTIDVYNANITATDTRNGVVINIDNYTSSDRKGLTFYGTTNNGGNYQFFGGGIDDTNPINALQVALTATPTAGTVKIWGIK